MAYAIDERHVAIAFAGGEVIDRGKPVKFIVQELGPLVVRSGAIAASDPSVELEPAPFAQPVPNGEHPVTLAIARFANDDERVAFARTKFSDATPATWKMALLPNQNSAKLAADHYFGYGVDSGTGCFMDPAAGKLFRSRAEADGEYVNGLVDEMDKTYRHTRSWLSFRPSAANDLNVVCFSSGFGDGAYASVFGFDAEGRVSQLVTDFGVLFGEEAAPRKKAWWQFW